MAKTADEGTGEYYQHYPNIAVVVTAKAKGRKNAMAVAWHSPLSFAPPLYGVSVSAKRFTYQLITESKEFGVNFLPFEQAELVAAVGGSKGEEVDKFRRFNLNQDPPLKTQVPILKAAYAAYECRLVDDHPYGDHRLLVGEVVAVHVLKEAFSPQGTLRLSWVKPILYLGNERYLTAAPRSVKYLDRKLYGQPKTPA